MPDFKLNDVIYDIPDNLVDQFKLDNPDAIEQPIKKSIRKQTRQSDLLGKVLPPQKEEKPSATVEEPVALEPTITEPISEDGFLESLKTQVLNVKTGKVADTLIKDYQPSPIQIGAKKTLIGFKQAIEGIEAKNAAANLAKFQQKVANEGLNPTDEIEYAGYIDVPVAEGTLEGAIRKITSPSKKGTVAEANKYYAEKLLTPLIQTQEYQETLKRFKSPEVLDGLTLDEYKQMIGEQGVQMLAAAGTFGLSTYYQETSNILIEAARKKAIEKNNITEQDFESYAPNIKANLMLEAFENGDIDIKKAVEGGVANAGLDLASSYFVLSKGLKFMPKDFFRALVNGRVKKILKYTASGVPPVLGEVVTEVGQERIAEIKTAEAIDTETPEIEIKKYAEVAAQTLLTTGGIQVGLKTGATSFREIQALTDINKIEARTITDEIKLKVNNNFKLGNITKQKRDELYNNIEAAEQIINDPKYKNFDSESKKITFDNILNKSAVEKQIENINQNISQQRKNNISTASEEFILNKKKEELNRYQNNIEKEIIFQNYKNNGKSLAQFVNNSTEGIFRDRNVEIFKNKQALFKYLENNNIKLKNEDINSIKEGVVNGFEKNGIAYILEDNIKNNLLKGTLNASNTVHHEVLHFVLNSMDQQTIVDIKNSVEKELNNSSDPSIKKIASIVSAQLEIYKEEDKPQEFFTAISDAFRTLEIFDNINNPKKAETFYNISESIKSIFNKKLPQLDINQLDGNNTLEWIKKYNSFNGTKPKFKINTNIGKVDIDEKEIKEDIQTSLTESSNKVQKIFNEKGKDGAFDIIEAYKPLTTKLTNKYRDVPGFDFELLQSEIEIGKRGLLDLINAYDPSKGATLNTYIQGQLANRAIEAANRILDTEFTLDVTEAKGVADISTVETIIEEKETAITEEAKKVTLSEGLDTSIEVNGVTLKETVNKSLEKAVALSVKKYNEEISKNRTVTPFIQSIKEGLAKDLRKPIKAFINSYPGGYEKFLQDNRGLILDNFTTTYLSKHPLFKKGIQKSSGGIKSIDAEGKAIFNANFISPTQIEKNKFDWVDENGKKLKIDRDSAAGRGLTSGPEIMRRDPQIKNKITENEFVDYHFQDGPRRTKKKQNPEDAIAMQIASELGFEYLKQDFTNKGPIFQKFSEVGDLLDVVIPDTADVQVIKDIDRGVIKFSMNTKGDGTWVPDLLNPLTGNKFYNFNVANRLFKISLFENDEFDYEIVELTEGIKEDTFANDPKSMAIAFRDIEDDSTEITGRVGAKDSVKVFSIVANSVLDIIKKDNLNSITFTAKEKNRQSLYQAMVFKFQKELGWESYSFPVEGEMAFVAYDPKLVENFIKEPGVKFSISKEDKALLNKYKIPNYEIKTINDVNTWINDVKKLVSIFNTEDYKLINLSTVLFNRKLIPNEKVYKYLETELKKLKRQGILPKTVTIGRSRPGQVFKNTPELFQDNLNKIESFNKKHKQVYNKMWQDIKNLIDKDKKLAGPIMYFLSIAQNERAHPMSLGAPLVAFQWNAKKFEYEHAMQQTYAYRRLMESILSKSNFDKEFNYVNDNYFVIALGKVNDSKLKKAGYANVFENSWKFWWQRYFNPKVAAIDGGIDPNDIFFVDQDGKKLVGLGDFLNINADGSSKIKFSKSLSLSKDFNKILQETKGVKWTQKFSPVEARAMGKGKGKRKFFIPYSADDFVGLLYTTLAPNKTGEKQMQWYQENLLRPFSRGIQQYEAAKQNALRQWNVIKKEAKKEVPGGLTKRNETGLTNQDAVRIYIWKQQGMEIPGISAKLITENIKIVKANPKLIEFADRLMSLNPEGYPKPSNSWDAGDITTDIVSYINGVKRSEFLEPWKNNVDKIFSEDNKNKLRALYGEAYVDALEDILHRMKTGRNRRMGVSKIEQRFMDWTNNSVGAIMFFNARSAVLQTLSTVNFINFTDNNPINAAKAFANLPQYWEDFSTLFNSDFLKQRRSGLQTDINADEIARAAKGAENTARAALSAILKFGFTPTQIADSFAIASGGATFYRNRINKYKKEGFGDLEAKQKAFTDFQEIAEETQQSARPDRISLQQASSLGRIVLAFGNTPMQYARLTKKAALDLINGRGDWKTNISKIMYYSVIQNIIFSALQQGLFALLFSDEEEDKEKERYYKLSNGVLDGFLRGTGVYGAAASTVKNMILKIIEESKKSRPDYTKVAIESTSLSPPINSKLRKLMAAGRTFTYKQSKEKVYTEGISLENPAFLAAGQVISAATNLPADRVVLKADHIKTAIEPETELWQSIALALGWSEWDLGMIEKQTKKESTRRRSRSRSRTRTRTRTRD